MQDKYPVGNLTDTLKSLQIKNLNMTTFKVLLHRSDIQRVLRLLNGMLRVKAGRGWMQWLLSLSAVIRGRNTAATARLAWHYVRTLVRLYRHQGVKGLVIATKSWYVLTMQAVGGMKIPSTQRLGCAVARASDGLPRVIPRLSRQRIREGDLDHLRLWVTWFSIYRVFTYPGLLKLSTITDPGTVLSASVLKEVSRAIPGFLGSLGISGPLDPSRVLESPKFVSLTRSTPSIVGPGMKVSGSIWGIVTGALAMSGSPVVQSFRWLAERLPPLEVDFYDVGVHKTFLSVFDLIVSAFPSSSSLMGRQIFGSLGRLGFKSEAAGKVRVFAMVECWTQWLLRPLHLYVFKILEDHPCDGTMDQFAPVDRLLKLGLTKFWCYDLSAATDRLPVEVQAMLLDSVFGQGFGRHWANLLVGRDYEITTIPNGIVVPSDIPLSVRYAVGQPMGALSSWAMLALTHHFIVAMAAMRVGYIPGTFRNYAVLGDDIVIADGRVAGAYLQLMAELGVEIGLAKSLVSRNGVLEFAKRFIVRGRDLSPVPVKELVAALVSFESSTTFILKYGLRPASLASLAGWGYKVRGRLSGEFSQLPPRLASIGRWWYSVRGRDPKKVALWFNIKSFVIRPRWLNVSESLPDLTAKVIQDWASKDESKMNFRLRNFPKDVSDPESSRLMKSFLNGTLVALAAEVPHVVDKVSLYLGLWNIQVSQWKITLPVLQTAQARARKVFFYLTLDRGHVTDVPFDAWLDAYKLRGNLFMPKRMGTMVPASRTPSLLFISRLHALLHSKNPVVSKKPPVATVEKDWRRFIIYDHSWSPTKKWSPEESSDSKG